jgi:hypothetical protein
MRARRALDASAASDCHDPVVDLHALEVHAAERARHGPFEPRSGAAVDEFLERAAHGQHDVGEPAHVGHEMVLETREHERLRQEDVREVSALHDDAVGCRRDAPLTVDLHDLEIE